MSHPTPVVHMIRVATPKMTELSVTKPTTDPAEVFEADLLAKNPKGTLKPTHTFDPETAARLDALAEELGEDLDTLLDEMDRDEAGEEEQTA